MVHKMQIFCVVYISFIENVFHQKALKVKVESIKHASPFCIFLYFHMTGLSENSSKILLDYIKGINIVVLRLSKKGVTPSRTCSVSGRAMSH